MGDTYSTKHMRRADLSRLIDFLQERDISFDADHSAETLSFDITELSSKMQSIIIKFLGEPIDENKMKKLTEAEKLKVKNFAKRLVGKKVLKEGKYYRLPKKVIGNDLYIFQKSITSQCESVMHGNDFDIDQWKSMLKDMQEIIKSAKEFDSEKDPTIPMNF